MKVTARGLVFALKSVGSYLASFHFAKISADPTDFFYGLLVFVLINVPTDLYLLNHFNNMKEKKRLD